MREQIGKATIYHSEQAGAEAASASMEKKTLYDIVSRQKAVGAHQRAFLYYHTKKHLSTVFLKVFKKICCGFGVKICIQSPFTREA